MPFTTYGMLSTRDSFDSDTKVETKRIEKKKKTNQKPHHLGSDRGDRYDYTNQMTFDILNKN